MRKILSNKKYFFMLLGIWCVMLIFFGRPYVTGDGYGYYAPYDILVSEGKFTTGNPQKYTQYADWAVGYVESKGEYAPIYTPGASIAWAPFITLFRIIDQIGPIQNINSMIADGKGHTLGTGIGILLGTSFYSFIAVYLTFKMLSKYFSKKISFLSSIAMFFSTYLFNYTFFEPSYVHALSTAFFVIAIYFIHKKIKINQNTFNLTFAGLALGLGSLIRTEVLVPSAIIFLLFMIYKRKDLLKIIIPFSVVFSFNFLYSYLAYGSFFATGFTTFCTNCKLFSLEYFSTDFILFDPVRGLLPWSPLITFLFFGIYLGLKNIKLKNEMKFSLLISFALIGFYSFWYNWWGGGSVGQRFLIILFPFFTLYLAICIEYLIKFSRKVKFNKLMQLTLLFLILSSIIYSLLIARAFYSFERTKLHISSVESNSRPYPEPAEAYTIYDLSKAAKGLVDPISLVLQDYHDVRDTLPVIIKKQLNQF